MSPFFSFIYEYNLHRGLATTGCRIVDSDSPRLTQDFLDIGDDTHRGLLVGLDGDNLVGFVDHSLTLGSHKVHYFWWLCKAVVELDAGAATHLCA